MATCDLDNDDYVANLLKQDAKKSTKEYEMVGLDAFHPKRLRNGAPKPNTRFLRHIIRETDSHNAALLAKEAEDSSARLRSLNKAAPARQLENGRLTPPDIEAPDRSSKRRKWSDTDDEGKGRQSRRRRERSRERSKYYSDEDTDEYRERRRAKRNREDRSKDRKHRHSRHTHEHSRHRRRRDRHEHSNRSRYDRFQEGDKSTPARRRKRSRSKSGSRSRSPSPLPKHRTSRHRHRSPSVTRSPDEASQSRSRRDNKVSTSKRCSRSIGSNSDPLESIVGPLPPPALPPVRMRGRGAHKVNSTTIDSRFSTEYDPNCDVLLESDGGDDWGDALEALKDRQRWKQQGAERLKAAGFTEDQVKKWANGDQKDEEDVKWTKRGEGREWDRGKVVDEDGDVGLKAEWGRLK